MLAGGNTSNTHLAEAIKELIATFIGTNALQVKEEYMLTQYAKKFDDNIMKLNDRITIINRLCGLFLALQHLHLTRQNAKTFSLT